MRLLTVFLDHGTMGRGQRVHTIGLGRGQVINVVQRSTLDPLSGISRVVAHLTRLDAPTGLANRAQSTLLHAT